MRHVEPRGVVCGEPRGARGDRGGDRGEAAGVAMSGRGAIGINDHTRAVALHAPVFSLLEDGPPGPRRKSAFDACYYRDHDEGKPNAYVAA